MRFFLDTGSGRGLWREERPEEAHLDDAIDHHALGLPRNTTAALDAAIALADLRVDWNDPGAPGPCWTAATQAALAELQADLRQRLSTELAGLGYRLAEG